MPHGFEPILFLEGETWGRIYHRPNVTSCSRSKIPGLYAAARCSHGFILSPVLGDLLARCIIGADTIPEIEPFFHCRFARSRLVRSRFTYGKSYLG